MKARILFSIIILAQAGFIQAREYPLMKSGSKDPGTKGQHKSTAAACAPGSGRADLDLNNVRTTIYTSGDMWWDLNGSARYEIPKLEPGSTEPSVSSLFAGSLWIGGLDNGGNLKAAAMMYRDGQDFWPGPLQLEGASTNSDVCTLYDEMFKVTRQEVESFVLGGEMTDVIENWPGNGIGNSTGFDPQLAPFIDGNGNGVYEPELRDTAGIAIEFPGYDVSGELGCDARLYGDETLWWVFNDNGNIHTETSGFPIGLEIRAQAFAFATNNALNNMTFYNYEIINRSTFTVMETYFGVWTDPDIGFYADDYAACDVGRGLGYVYNGDELDETVNGYGENPPAVGIDFFEGPFEDPDGLDGPGDACDLTGNWEGRVKARAKNGLGYGDSIVDNERIGMARFIYFTSTGPNYANDPSTGQHVYNYLRGIWKDGTVMQYGGNGYGPGLQGYSYMFPGDTDPQGIGYMVTGTQDNCLEGSAQLEPWSIDQFGSVPPSDFRILQSAGPFELAPGGVNKVTFGVVWGRASSGGRLASVEVMRRVDDDAQALFDNCFSIINGPDAPPVDVVELDKEVILLLKNECTDKIVNYTDNTAIPGFGDVNYKFQGYMIYQLKDLTVTVSDLKDVNRARIVAQVDIKDEISMVVNRPFDNDMGENVPEIEVNGSNSGLRNSFRITNDLFATGNSTLVNHKKYYFLVLSYSVAEDLVTNLAFGQTFLAGRRTCGSAVLEKYVAIPHINSPQAGGMVIQSKYGDTPSLTRIEGQGNGGNVLDLTEGTVAEILAAPYWVKNPVYERNAGPAKITIVNPVAVPNGDFSFLLGEINDNPKWKLALGNDTVYSDTTANPKIEQIITKWGFSVQVEQVVNPGVDVEDGNGFVEGSIVFSDNTRQWLNFVTDGEGCANATNWIRSGLQESSTDNPDCGDILGVDPGQFYEKVLGGTWAPFILTSRYNDGPAYSTANAIQVANNLQRVASVDIIITLDKSKWTRCPVVETTDDENFSEGGAEKLDLRAAASVNKEGLPDGDGTGMGWFPGYAINVETGERLNMAFGESSRLTEDNGRDMRWNPSSRTIEFSNGNIQNLLGGKHFIYVFNHARNGADDVPRYDEGVFIRQRLTLQTAPAKRNVYRDCIWTSIPVGVANQQFLTNDVKIRLRVNKPYALDYNATETEPDPKNANRPMYSFNTADLYARTGDVGAATSALDLINIVPNPYYAYSAYETSQLDNRVKITNLPQDCKIRIYTVGGMLVRTFDKGDPLTSLDWNLKNQAGVTVSSGIYLIHVEVPGVGEKIIKFFGVMRPIDLDTF